MIAALVPTKDLIASSGGMINSSEFVPDPHLHRLTYQQTTPRIPDQETYVPNAHRPLITLPHRITIPLRHSRILTNNCNRLNFRDINRKTPRDSRGASRGSGFEEDGGGGGDLFGEGDVGGGADDDVEVERAVSALDIEVGWGETLVKDEGQMEGGRKEEGRRTVSWPSL